MLGGQWPHRFLPPHSGRVSLLIVLPVIVSAFLNRNWCEAWHSSLIAAPGQSWQREHGCMHVGEGQVMDFYRAPPTLSTFS